MCKLFHVPIFKLLAWIHRSKLPDGTWVNNSHRIQNRLQANNLLLCVVQGHLRIHSITVGGAKGEYHTVSSALRKMHCEQIYKWKAKYRETYLAAFSRRLVFSSFREFDALEPLL